MCHFLLDLQYDSFRMFRETMTFAAVITFSLWQRWNPRWCICSISANKIYMGIFRAWKSLCMKTLLPPHHSPLSVTQLLSPHYHALNISMKIGNITTRWFPERLWRLNKTHTWHVILVKIIFQKQHFEKVRPERTCCSLSHRHSVMPAYPAVDSGI